MRRPENDQLDSTPDRDPETVALLRARNPAGLQRLLEDYGVLVRARLRQVFGSMLDDSELDEAMALASVRAWQAAPRFDELRGTLRAWLSVIARNCALRLLEVRRKRQREVQQNVDELLPSTFVPPAPGPERQKLMADLARCLEQLPPLQRAVLQADLDAGDAVPAAILAARLKTSANSIYVSRLKARRRLRIDMQALGHFLDETKHRGNVRAADAEMEAEQS